MLVHGCMQSEHANDTVAHYNQYRLERGLPEITCNPFSEVVEYHNGTTVVPPTRCIMHVVQVAAWVQDESTSTTTTEGVASTHENDTITPDTVDAVTRAQNEEEAKRDHTAVIIVVVVAALAGIAVVAWLVYDRTCRREDPGMVFNDSNPVYEIPVNTGPVYDNIDQIKI